MVDRTIVCYVGLGCVNAYEGSCLLRGFKLYEREPKTCDDYYEKSRYNR